MYIEALQLYGKHNIKLVFVHRSTAIIWNKTNYVSGPALKQHNCNNKNNCNNNNSQTDHKKLQVFPQKNSDRNLICELIQGIMVIKLLYKFQIRKEMNMLERAHLQISKLVILI